MYGIIYKATNLVNGKIYVGQTKRTLNARIKAHIYRKNDSLYFHEAIRKYGENGFKWEIIDHADSLEELNKKEKFWIKFYNPSLDRNIGYNLTTGGERLKELSELTKLKIGQKHKNKTISFETRQKISSSLKGRKLSESCLKQKREYMLLHNPMKGKTHSESTKRLIGNKSLGRKLSKEAKEKISIAHKGKIVSKETRAKISKANKGRQLPKKTEKQRKIISERQFGGLNHRAKKIKCIETGIIYSCIQEASRETGLCYKSISRCCNNQQKSAGGYKFQFYL